MIATAPGEPGLVARVGSAPLWAHGVALALILLLTTAVVSTNGMFSSDEGAVLLQRSIVAETGSWTVVNPLPALDPDGERFAAKLSDGGPTTFAPYGKHPLYPVLLLPVVGSLGTFGAVLLSIIGTVVAAAAAARLVSAFAPGAARLCFWATGLLSPLFFDSQLVIAHTIGAALCGWCTWFVVVAYRDRRPVAWAARLAAAVTIGATVLLRTEGLLYAAALGGTVGVLGLVRRSWPGVATGASVVAGAAVALVGERVWTSRLLTGVVDAPSGGLSGEGSFLAGRVEATIWTLVAPTGARSGPVTVVAVIVSILVLLAGLRLRGAAPRWRDALVLLTVAAVVAVGGIVVAPDAISGILVATPFLLFGLTQLRRADLTPEPQLVLAGTVAAFTLLVLATTYSFGGGAEWGARFLALAIPAAVAVAMQPIERLLRARRGRDDARRVVLVAAGIGVAFSLIAVRALHESHARSNEVVVALGAALDRADVVASGPDLGDGDRRPIVLLEDHDLGRMAWRDAGAMRAVNIDVDELADLVGEAGRLGARTVVVAATDPAASTQAIDGAGWRVVAEVPAGGDRSILVATQGS